MMINDMIKLYKLREWRLDGTGSGTGQTVLVIISAKTSDSTDKQFS
jgi:hypothetical protein